MNVQVSLSIYDDCDSFKNIHRSGNMESYGNSIFSFWQVFILISIVVVQVYILSSSIQDFFFLYVLTSI